MREHHPCITLLYVPPNVTSKCQPLDVGCNRPFKNGAKNFYCRWAAARIADSLDNGEPVDLKSTTVKPMVPFFAHEGLSCITAAMVVDAWSKANLLRAFERDYQRQAVVAHDQGVLFETASDLPEAPAEDEEYDDGTDDEQDVPATVEDLPQSVQELLSKLKELKTLQERIQEQVDNKAAEVAAKKSAKSKGAAAAKNAAKKAAAAAAVLASESEAGSETDTEDSGTDFSSSGSSGDESEDLGAKRSKKHKPASDNVTDGAPDVGGDPGAGPSRPAKGKPMPAVGVYCEVPAYVFKVKQRRLKYQALIRQKLPNSRWELYFWDDGSLWPFNDSEVRKWTVKGKLFEYEPEGEEEL